MGMRLPRRSLLLGSSGMVALAAVLVAVFLSGFGRVIEGGPLGPQTYQTTTCAPLAVGHILTDGFDVLMDQGRQPVTIERLSLRSPRGLRLVGAYIVPLARPDSDATGFWLAFPPPARQLARETTGVEWARRENPHGARILPGHKVNTVLGIRLTGRRPASAIGLDVRYESGGQQYDFITHSHLVIKPAPESCP